MGTNTTRPALSLGVICTPDEWKSSTNSDRDNNTNPVLHCLTRGQSIGLAITTEAAFVSIIALLILFALIGRNVARRIRNPQFGKWSLIQEPADVYMLSLFAADLIQAVGTVLDIKWIMEGKVRTGTFCTAQGLVQQLGETPVAMNTLAIAVHTFVTVWWRKALHARAIALVAVGCIWTYVLVFIIIGVTSKANYMTPTPYWCWIGPGSSSLRLAGEYVWLWAALVTSVVLYVPLFFWGRGNITVLDKWWKFKVHRKQHMSESLEATATKIENERARKRIALGMLAYPLTYSFIVLPLSIVRWITFKHGAVPSAWTFFIITIYGLSGCANVLLVLITRPQLLLFGEPSGKTALPDNTAGSQADRGRARTPGVSGTRTTRGKVPLPSDSPSPSRERPAGGDAGGAANKLGTAQPHVTVTTVGDMYPTWTCKSEDGYHSYRNSGEDGYNPYRSSGEDRYSLAPRARARPPSLDASGGEPARSAPWITEQHYEGGRLPGMGAEGV